MIVTGDADGILFEGVEEDRFREKDCERYVGCCEQEVAPLPKGSAPLALILLPTAATPVTVGAHL